MRGKGRLNQREDGTASDQMQKKTKPQALQEKLQWQTPRLQKNVTLLFPSARIKCQHPSATQLPCKQAELGMYTLTGSVLIM